MHELRSHVNDQLVAYLESNSFASLALLLKLSAKRLHIVLGKLLASHRKENVIFCVNMKAQ